MSLNFSYIPVQFMGVIILYMAAVASLRCNEQMKKFYRKLKAKGKPSKVALVAVAHKILITLNAMCKNKKRWEQNFS